MIHYSSSYEHEIFYKVSNTLFAFLGKVRFQKSDGEFSREKKFHTFIEGVWCNVEHDRFTLEDAQLDMKSAI